MGESIAHRGGAAGALNAKGEVLIGGGVRRRVFGAHLRPVGVQLLRDEGGKAGERALAEFNVLDDHRDGVVLGDADEGVEADRAGGRLGRSLPPTGRCAPMISAAPPARKPRRVGENLVMDQASSILAALWIALRMRT